MDGYWFMPQVHAAGPVPPPRGGHASAAVGTKLLIFGGADRQATPLKDLWVLETAGGHYLWTQIMARTKDGLQIQPRSGATMTAIGEKVYLYGGQDPVTGICYDDILVLDTKIWEWSVVEVESGRPPARHSHCTGLFKDVCLVSTMLGSPVALVFGGAGMHGTLGDLWIFNTVECTWIAPVFEGAPPCPREMHTGTMISDGRMLVCGGRSPQGQVLCDLSVFDGDEMRWSNPVPTPFFLCAHSAVTMLFPGHTLAHSALEPSASSTLDVALASDWVANGGEASPSEVSSLQPDRALVLIYGGFSGNGIDGWVLAVHPDTMQVDILDRGPYTDDEESLGKPKPAARFAHSAVSVPSNGGSYSKTEMVVFGGVNPSADLNDIAIWRGRLTNGA